MPMKPTLKICVPRLNPSVWILAAIVVVLAVLAAMQYRWIMEVSQAERERLRENLRLATVRFTDDFDGEIMRLIFMGRRPGPRPRPQDSPYEAEDLISDRLARQYDEWMATSVHPRLLQDVFLAKVIGPGDVDLLRFDRDSNTLIKVAWPSEFAKFHSFCVAESLTAGREELASRMPDDRRLEDLDLEGIPAISFPVGFSQPQQFRDRLRGFPPRQTSWEIIRIDRTAFDEFVSSLVQKHFPKHGDFDYNILIADGTSGNVAYRSSADLNIQDFQKGADASLNLRLGFGARGRPSPNTGFPRDGNIVGFQPRAGVVKGWQLYVKHHSGSLDSFAGQFRARNLAFSFAVFALLAIGIAFTFISSERVKAMGKLQLEFAAGLSHELRTPLTAIRSAGYNLRHGNVAEEDVARYGEMIQEQGNRLSEMVEQALLFAQIQAGRNRYEPAPVEIGSVIGKVISSCGGASPMCTNEIVADVAPDLPPAITDENALNHCLRNLLMNAVKYGEPSGSICISARLVEQTPKSEIAITVENTGPAIDSADLPHLFEPFYRGKNTNGKPGNGLGLYMVSSIMKSIGGRVQHSNSVAGTRFTLYIPAVGPSFLEAAE